MRPVELTIQGLRSFRAPVTINFTGRDHLAIVGDTGAGKSSILEAITYALYGKVSFSAQANQELMNDASADLRVVLRFRVSGETWEVARTLRRDGRGTVRPRGVQLRRLDEDAAEQIEGVRQVNDRIMGLIGLDSEAFLRTVILPQGRFARLLVEDKPSERSRILRQVWRTDELEAVGTLAEAAHREVVRLKDRLDHAASAYPEDLAAHLEQLNRIQQEEARRAAAASAMRDQAAGARDALLDARRTHRTASAVARTLRLSKIDQAEKRLAPIERISRRIQEEDESLAQQQAGVRDALGSIPEGDGPVSGEVAEALTKLKDIVALARKAVEAADRLRDGMQASSERSAEAERAAEAERRATEKLKCHGAGKQPLVEAFDLARARRLAVKHAYQKCEEQKAVLARGEEHLSALRKEASQLAGRLEAAREEERHAKEAAIAAQASLATAQRFDSAAAAARDLLPGNECPVCLRSLPTDWKAPPDGDLKEAEAEAVANRAQAENAGKQVAELAERLRGARLRTGEDEEAVAAAKTAWRGGLTALAAESGIDPDAPLLPLDALLVPLDEALRGASEALAGHDKEHERLSVEATGAAKAAARAMEAAVGAEAWVRNARGAAASALGHLRDTVRTVPSPYRPRLDLPPGPDELRDVDTTPVDDQIMAATERRNVLAYREAQRRRLREELDRVEKTRTALARRRDREVVQPIQAILVGLNHHRDALMNAIRDLELDPEAPGPPVADIPGLQSSIDALRTTTTEVLRAAAQGAETAEAGANAASATLEGIKRQLDGDFDGSAADAVVEATVAATEEARFRARRALEDAEAFTRILDKVRRLRTILGEATELARALRDLDAALKPGAFLKWLTLRRSRILLVHASRMLREMSGGRYGFADPGETEEWRVLDHDSMQPRSPASLSGGEQFIASLALALGMVEMMARSGGRLEALFLDEGFGSLDRNNLDAAIQALGTTAAGGRMVGVISHVRAVAEQIDHVLSVRRSATGSQAVWLSSDQRRQLSRPHVGWEGPFSESPTSMEGLLE